jgi:ferrous iron transport protein A
MTLGRDRMQAEHLLPLEMLSPGEWAEVADVHGDAPWVCRMAELGLRAGCRLRMIRGGCPCLFQIGGTRLSLRGDDSMRVLVRPLARAV